MRIIVEGPDGAGKTTLVKELAAHFNCDILTMTEFGSKKMTDYEQKAKLNNIISDRCFLSELVYASVADRKHVLSPHEYETLIRMYQNKGWKFIILDASVECLLDRLNKRGGEDQWKIDKITNLKTIYLMLAKFYDLKIIDSENLDVNDLIKDLEEGTI